jgi:hypothetical protein
MSYQLSKKPQLSQRGTSGTVNSSRNVRVFSKQLSEKYKKEKKYLGVFYL